MLYTKFTHKKMKCQKLLNVKRMRDYNTYIADAHIGART